MNITPIIETVFALIAAVITAIVIPYIRSKTTAQQQTEINAWVRIAVSAAEQIYVGSGRRWTRCPPCRRAHIWQGLTGRRQRRSENIIMEAA